MLGFVPFVLIAFCITRSPVETDPRCIVRGTDEFNSGRLKERYDVEKVPFSTLWGKFGSFISDQGSSRHTGSFGEV